jgi:hypothetical protein
MRDTTEATKYVCPACGYPNLEEEPRSVGGGGSYEICPSCGFQFGVSDDDLGHAYEDWRRRWIDAGMRWNSIGQKRPDDWDPHKNLERLLGKP